MMRLLLMTNACRMVSGRRFVFLPMCFRTPSREFGIRQGEHRDTQSFIVSRLKWSTQSLSRSFASGLEVTFANGVSGKEASRKRCRAGCILGRQAFPPPRCGASGQTLCVLKFIHARVKALCISVFPLPSYIELALRIVADERCDRQIADVHVVFLLCLLCFICWRGSPGPITAFAAGCPAGPRCRACNGRGRRG